MVACDRRGFKGVLRTSLRIFLDPESHSLSRCSRRASPIGWVGSLCYKEEGGVMYMFGDLCKNPYNTPSSALGFPAYVGKTDPA